MIKIIHIITGLGSGGAENMLYKLIKYSDKKQYYHEVISLMDEGVMGDKIKKEGIKIHSLKLCWKNPISSILKARKICANFDIVNTWLYHADVFGFIIAKLFLNKKLIWNIRHSNLDKNVNKSRTLKIIKLNSILSRSVDYITYNSYKAFENHIKVGYIDKNPIIIHNGFELDRFKFDLKARIKVRNELEVNEEEKVIITVGRWDIQKDYYTLLKSLNEFKKQNLKFKMVMVGSNLDYSNKELKILIAKYKLEGNMILLGQRTDIPDILSASDIYVSSSLGESFSNAIGEAMACEMYCVVTDVGDSKIMVGDTGEVAEAENYEELTKVLIKAYSNSNFKKNGKRARQRVLEKYDITEVVENYESVFDDCFK